MSGWAGRAVVLASCGGAVCCFVVVVLRFSSGNLLLFFLLFFCFVWLLVWGFCAVSGLFGSESVVLQCGAASVVRRGFAGLVSAAG